MPVDSIYIEYFCYNIPVRTSTDVKAQIHGGINADSETRCANAIGSNTG